MSGEPVSCRPHSACGTTAYATTVEGLSYGQAFALSGEAARP